MDDILYREQILERYHDAPHRGRLAVPDLFAELDNSLCGDRIRRELAVGPGGRIGPVRFDGQGCVINQVAASFLAEHLEGMPVERARNLPAGAALELIGVRLSPMRARCALLAWLVLQLALSTPLRPTDGGAPGAHPPAP
jgi:nitrogen fixation NifU-like protein